MSEKNHQYFGDNLDVLRRYVADESVDLVYLDPPFKRRGMAIREMKVTSRSYIAII